MARTKKSQVLAKYREQERQAKEAYKERTGLKIAYNFSKSDEAQKIGRNRKRALRRYEDKKIEAEVQKKVFSLKPEEVTKFNVITDEEFYFNVLYSAPGEADSLVINMFELAKTSGRPILAIIQDEDGSTKTYKSQYEFDKAINKLYTDLMKRQKEDYDAANKIFKSNPANKDKKLPKSEFIRLASITAGIVGGVEIVTLRITNPEA